jgi:hypothetical protein
MLARKCRTFLADCVAHGAHWAAELDDASVGREPWVVADAAFEVPVGVRVARSIEKLLSVEPDG